MKTPLEKLIEETLAERTPAELALGWLRYETLRRCTVRAYSHLTIANLQGTPFDDLVTDELLKWKETK